MTKTKKIYLGASSALAVALSLACAGGAMAQVSSATLRGTIYEGAVPETGGSVVATDTASGYTTRARIGANGVYVLPGLRPGSYRIAVTTADGQTAEDTVTVVLGQVATLDLDVAPVVTGSTDAGATELGEVVVTGRRIFEVRTSEVATNVSQQQINDLPQISRNFLNFAALAPGVVVQEGDTERTISAGGQPSTAINVFIDGQNQKATIIDGGVAGQDDSRGNPFPQAAIQEFRVLTQNFKAEYEQASSAIITSVSRSGTNELSGDLFVQWQDGDWIERNDFSANQPKPRLDRLQYGGSIGGPIIEDRLHYFLAYERKEETRDRSVFLNRPEYAPLFTDQLGTFTAPFEEDLLFGKLSWQIDDRQRLELSGTYRSEFDIRDFGNGATSAERATTVNTDVRSLVLKHQFYGDGFFNEASVDYFSSTYNPRAVNFDLPGQRYVVYRDNCPDGNAPTAACPAPLGFQFNYNSIDTTVFTAGGGQNNQDIQQESLTFKNDLTFNEVEWMGRHTIKAGIKYSMQEYYVAKQFNRNPVFTYDIDGRPEVLGNRAIPTRVELALPVDPTVAKNNVFGIYLQDDWQVTDKLEVNLGIRWDYEDNAVNNDYSTPDVVRRFVTALAANPAYVSTVDLSNYISRGGRDAFTGAIQPRIGFSYDIFGDEQTVLFGGAGRYYDRIGFNFAFSEINGPFNRTKTINFSPAGGTYGGQTGTIAWDPRYATREGLDALLGGTVGTGEVFLVRNDAEMPHTDQFNFGVRQKFGEIQTALTFSYAKTENEFGWYRLNVNNANSVVVPLPGVIDPDTGVAFPFRNAFYSDHNREREYQAIYLTIDKPYNSDAGYGFNIAYTYAEATQNGSRDQGLSNFDFDYASIAATPTFNSPGTDRHRLVMSGTVDLPWDFRLSSLITLGSGKPFTGSRPSAVGKPMWFEFYPEKHDFIIPNAWAYRQVDLRLAREFEIWGGDVVEFTLDAINVFNFANYSNFDQTYQQGSTGFPLNPNFGRPTAQFVPTRSFQVGLRYRW